MIMTQGNVYSIAHQSLAEDHTDVNRRAINTATRHHNTTDEAEIVIEQKHVRFLNGEIMQLFVEETIELFGTIKLFFLQPLGTSARSQLTSR